MRAGFTGTFVISWSQTEIDGLEAASMNALTVGSSWAWRGDALRVDGPSDVLRLERTDGDANLRKRATHMVRRLVGAAMTHKSNIDDVDVSEPLMDSHFVVTDGRESYTITVIETGPASQPLLMFLNAIPPRGTDLWIVHQSLGTQVARPVSGAQGGVICFTPGTRISTPDGARPIEELREGDRIMTRDSGPQDIMWIGKRRMTGARMFVMPELRPIRFRPGALGIERPDQELLVSPEHRMLIRGHVARSLFNTPEVLVPARDLVNGSNIFVDLQVREVEYIHLLLPHHQVIWANGVEAESFHPASAALSALTEGDRARLLRKLPGMEINPHVYGDYARRNLSASEAAILMHEAA
ncbi:MAG: Hint domain-containing protein [Aestuariivita sp.]|uniref:Hint domain-containing protein n=1 Tax=Aestuariivita sp. TaxID=1872407 RepID=UPI003BAFBA83